MSDSSVGGRQDRRAIDMSQVPPASAPLPGHRRLLYVGGPQDGKYAYMSLAIPARAVTATSWNEKRRSGWASLPDEHGTCARYVPIPSSGQGDPVTMVWCDPTSALHSEGGAPSAAYS